MIYQRHLTHQLYFEFYNEMVAEANPFDCSPAWEYSNQNRWLNVR